MTTTDSSKSRETTKMKAFLPEPSLRLVQYTVEVGSDTNIATRITSPYECTSPSVVHRSSEPINTPCLETDSAEVELAVIKKHLEQ
jgi:hypothetical protein